MYYLIGSIIFALVATYLSRQDSWTDFMESIPLWIRIVLFLLCVFGLIFKSIKAYKDNSRKDVK